MSMSMRNPGFGFHAEALLGRMFCVLNVCPALYAYSWFFGVTGCICMYV
jgi:hypothetical protein